MACFVLGCSNEKTEVPGRICVVDSDCLSPLVCSYGLCHEACRQNGDCPSGQRCVWANEVGDGGPAVGTSRSVRVCLLEERSSCTYESMCRPDLVCGRDLQCRNECLGDRDCPDPGDRCIAGGLNGEFICATDGVITDLTDGGPDAGPADAAFAAEVGVPVDVPSSFGDAGPEANGADASSGSQDGSSMLTEREPTNDTVAGALQLRNQSVVTACICEKTDVDVFQVTAPAGNAGGYFKVAVRDIGKGVPVVAVDSASTNGNIAKAQTTVGTSFDVWWAAAAGETYNMSVTRWPIEFAPFNYTLSIAFTAINDPFEPNDTRDQAKPLTLGETVEAYFFTGTPPARPALAAYQDWFAVTVMAGPVSVKVENVALDLRLRFRAYDENFVVAQAVNDIAANAGANVNGTFTAPSPGTYRVVIEAVAASLPVTGIDAVPESFTKPYRLTVSQSAQ